jgi:DNA repair protein RAD57
MTMEELGYDASMLVLETPENIARRCRISPAYALSLLQNVCNEALETPSCLEYTLGHERRSFTTGDVGLDELLGEGIHVGRVYEISGERCACTQRVAFVS